MERIRFKAYVLANDLDLNRIASECNIPKKYTWEEPLILKHQLLERIFHESRPDDSAVYLFSFGSIVLVNLAAADEPAVFSFVKKLHPRIDLGDASRYTDDYELRIGSNLDHDLATLNDKFVTVERFERYHLDLIAMVIAKSVALEKIEQRLTDIMDGLEPLIDRLEQGKLRVSDKRLAQVSSKIARYEYNTLAYIMLLDKPDITWAISEALSFYDKMSDFFELTDRYEVLKQKTALLSNVVNGISSMSHTVKSVLIEVAILILILVEVVIMLIELFK
jgi:uncharacterized Rmd1/YagE family protein